MGKKKPDPDDITWAPRLRLQVYLWTGQLGDPEIPLWLNPVCAGFGPIIWTKGVLKY